MNGGKVALLVVTMLALGVLVLPNTVSLFAGQHYWYNLSGTGNDVPCQKCHADVFEELGNSAFHIHWAESGWDVNNPDVADQYDCEACHRSNKSITYASVNGSFTTYTPGKQAHAASVVACMLCHQDNASYATSAPGYFAGGFNVTMFDPNYNAFNYTNATHKGQFEAHNAFIYRAIQNTTLQDSNEACIACHTWVPVKINWTHAVSLEFDVGLEDDAITEYGPHNWTITDWSYNGTTYAIVWGNTTGYGSTTYDSSVWPGTNPSNYTGDYT